MRRDKRPLGLKIRDYEANRGNFVRATQCLLHLVQQRHPILRAADDRQCKHDRKNAVA